MPKDLTTDDVRRLLREHTDVASQKHWAAEAGVSAAYVNDVLQGRREPGQAICDALGIERIVTYRFKRKR